jgi:hypothetical protein
VITFEGSGGQVVVYSPERSGPSWLDDKLDSEGDVTLSRTFTVRKEDLRGRAGQDDLDDFDEDIRRFAIGTVEDGYRTIRKDVLGLKHDFLIAASVELRHQTFVAERNISVFRRIDELIDEQIVVGGPAWVRSPRMSSPDFCTTFRPRQNSRTMRERGSRVCFASTWRQCRTPSSGWRPTWNGGQAPRPRPGENPMAGYPLRTSWSLRSSRTSETA